MAVRVMIKRHIKEGKTAEVTAILNGLRATAIHRHGYISGETLVNHYNDRIIMVVSSWKTVEDWINWQENEERDAKEAHLRDFLMEPPVYEIYDLGV